MQDSGAGKSREQLPPRSEGKRKGAVIQPREEDFLEWASRLRLGGNARGLSQTCREGAEEISTPLTLLLPSDPFLELLLAKPKKAKESVLRCIQVSLLGLRVECRKMDSEHSVGRQEIPTHSTVNTDHFFPPLLPAPGPSPHLPSAGLPQQIPS